MEPHDRLQYLVCTPIGAHVYRHLDVLPLNFKYYSHQACNGTAYIFRAKIRNFYMNLLGVRHKPTLKH